MKIKYRHMLNRPLKSRLSKSRYLHVYLFFIEFQNPSDIPFDDIARLTNEDPVSVRALMRPAINNESIADALVDIGVRVEDIPPWFATSNTLKRMLKNVKKSPLKVRSSIIPHIQGESPSVYPATNYLNLPSIVRTPEEVEDARNRDRIQAQVAIYNRVREETIQIINWKINQAREEEKREKQKERDMKDLMARMNARALFYTLMRNFQFNQMMYAWIMSQPLHTTNPKKEFFDVIRNLCDTMINFIKDLNERKQIRNVDVELESLEPGDWTDLNDQIKEILNNEPSIAEEIKPVLEFRDELREKNRIKKQIMYPYLRPQEIHYPPGFKPVKLLKGPLGERIDKLLNLDHLRE